MSDDEAGRTFVAWNLIAQDLEFSARFVSSVQNKPEVSWLVSYGLIPYISMFIYETYGFLQKSHPEIAGSIDLTEYSTIKSSRHSVKLLDTPHSIDDLAQYFKHDVVAHFEDMYAPPNNPIGWLLRPLYTDLGVYSYGGRLVNTTHVASFELGVDRRRLLSASSSDEVVSIYEEYGRFLTLLGHGLQPGATSFASHIEAAKITWEDKKSKRYYLRHFDSNPGSYDSGLNCLLTALQANLAFLNLMVDVTLDPQSAPTLCKIHLVCVVHVVASCSALLKSHRHHLDRLSIAVLESALGDGSGPALQSRNIKFLRNALVHYLPHGDFLREDLKPDKIFCGLVEKYCSGLSYLEILEVSITEARRLGGLMDQWSERTFR